MILCTSPVWLETELADSNATEFSIEMAMADSDVAQAHCQLLCPICVKCFTTIMFLNTFARNFWS
jgi:hypothetical protein